MPQGWIGKGVVALVALTACSTERPLAARPRAEVAAPAANIFPAAQYKRVALFKGAGASEAVAYASHVCGLVVGRHGPIYSGGPAVATVWDPGC